MGIKAHKCLNCSNLELPKQSVLIYIAISCANKNRQFEKKIKAESYVIFNNLRGTPFVPTSI